MLNNKKLFFIFLFILGFMFLLSSKNFAFTYDNVEFPDFVVDEFDSSESWADWDILIIKEVSSNDVVYKFYFSPAGVYDKYYDSVVSGGLLQHQIKFRELSQNTYKVAAFYSTASNSYTTGPTSWTNSAGQAVTFCAFYDSSDTTVFTSVDIADEQNNVVFPAPPHTVEATAILAPVVQQTEMSQTLSEMVNLLPTVLVIVVSFLGLRKGLRMLFKVLRMA